MYTVSYYQFLAHSSRISFSRILPSFCVQRRRLSVIGCAPQKTAPGFPGAVILWFLALYSAGSHTFDDVLLASQIEDDNGDNAQ